MYNVQIMLYFHSLTTSIAPFLNLRSGGMSLTLLMASLYAVDVSVLETCEDSDDILQRLPMTSDVEYMKQVGLVFCCMGVSGVDKGAISTSSVMKITVPSQRIVTLMFCLANLYGNV